MNNMLHKIHLLALLIVGTNIYSQTNLVPNNSFENTTCCPTNGTELVYIPSCVLPWFNPSAGDPDYFNICSSPSPAIPNNWCGYQPTKTGNAYAGFFLYAGGNIACGEYLETILNDTLIAGKKYYISFYVSFCTSSNYALDAVGAYFSNDSLLSNSSCHFSNIPQVQNTKGNVIKDTTNWVQVSGTFVAQGGERFITIGNFTDFDSTNFDTVPWGADGRSYYLLDDVSVVDSGWAGINEVLENISINVYPNPASSEINIKAAGNGGKNYIVIIYNSIGSKVTEQKFSGQTKISTTAFSKGIYQVQVCDLTPNPSPTGEGSHCHTERVVIQ